MNQETNDQAWKPIQFHIDQLVGHFLKENYPAIEYKTLISGLLQMSPEYNKETGE